MIPATFNNWMGRMTRSFAKVTSPGSTEPNDENMDEIMDDSRRSAPAFVSPAPGSRLSPLARAVSTA